MQQNAVGDVAEELIERLVFEQFSCELAESLQLRGVAGVISDLLDIFDWDGDRRSGFRVGDCQEAVSVVLVAFENELCVAEADAISGVEGTIAIDAHAVEERTVRAAAVFQHPGPVHRRDLCVLAGEIAVLDRNRAVGCTANRGRLSIQLLPEWRV